MCPADTMIYLPLTRLTWSQTKVSTQQKVVLLLMIVHKSQRGQGSHLRRLTWKYDSWTCQTLLIFIWLSSVTLSCLDMLSMFSCDTYMYLSTRYVPLVCPDMHPVYTPLTSVHPLPTSGAVSSFGRPWVAADSCCIASIFWWSPSLALSACSLKDRRQFLLSVCWKWFQTIRCIHSW